MRVGGWENRELLKRGDEKGFNPFTLKGGGRVKIKRG